MIPGMRGTLYKLIHDVRSETHYELACMGIFENKKPYKWEKFKLWTTTTILVIWDELLSVTCIHREKNYTSSATSETGWEEFECKRCKKFWTFTYY